MVLNSCTTTRNALKIDYIPSVPDPYTDNGVLIVDYDEKSDIVTMPYWYWRKIVLYINDTQIIFDTYVNPN